MKPEKSGLALALSLAAVIFAACHHSSGPHPGAPPVDSTAALRLELLTDQIHAPVVMAAPPDTTGRLFVGQKEGKIWILRNHQVNPIPFLDLSDRVVRLNPGYDERGLLGLAFSPHFAEDGKCYVYYSAPISTTGYNHQGVLAEYQVSREYPDRADPATERVLLRVPEPESNHNGGDIHFGPDGYLYLALGDGGGSGDRHGDRGNGQDLQTLLGKILRIDVRGEPYAIPEDNPFAGRKDARGEIWAYGLRNPWRISFDRQTGTLFAGDVGQNHHEEVDVIRRGGNYGWRLMEGLQPYALDSPIDTAGLVAPIATYDHAHTGVSVIGGYVYRGHNLPFLRGQYVFGDYNGRLFTLEQASDGSWTRKDLVPRGLPDEGFQLYSFGQDREGELYLLGVVARANNQQGKIFRLVR